MESSWVRAVGDLSGEDHNGELTAHATLVATQIFRVSWNWQKPFMTSIFAVLLFPSMQFIERCFPRVDSSPPFESSLCGKWRSDKSCGVSIPFCYGIVCEFLTCNSFDFLYQSESLIEHYEKILLRFWKWNFCWLKCQSDWNWIELQLQRSNILQRLKFSLSEMREHLETFNERREQSMRVCIL